MTANSEPRATVARLLRESRAHAGLARAVTDFPPELAGRQVDGFRHTAWQQVEHLRLAAEDLVRYCLDADYEELEFPAGYWPATAAPPTPAAFEASVHGLLAATERMAALVEDPARDLLARAPTADDASHHTLRAALILLDHNGYHAGQLVALRTALGAWPPAG